MLIIRLSRIGRKNDPSFRIVLQEKHRVPTGKAIEFLGFYNSRLKQKSFKEERIKYWLGQGAQASDTVHNLLVSAKIIDKPKRKATTISKKKGKKEQQSTEPEIKQEEKTDKEEKTESDKEEKSGKPEEKQIIKKDNISKEKEAKKEIKEEKSETEK
ncbi:30S ribosomal protein S16 [bacterium]|nr:MAG: 30S ribosomal protein S16 [bacterium]